MNLWNSSADALLLGLYLGRRWHWDQRPGHTASSAEQERSSSSRLVDGRQL